MFGRFCLQVSAVGVTRPQLSEEYEGAETYPPGPCVGGGFRGSTLTGAPVAKATRQNKILVMSIVNNILILSVSVNRVVVVAVLTVVVVVVVEVGVVGVVKVEVVIVEAAVEVVVVVAVVILVVILYLQKS